MNPSPLQNMFEPFFDAWIRTASFGLLAGAWKHMESKTSSLNSVNETLRQSYPQQANGLIEAVLNKATNELHAPAIILLQLYTLALGNLQIDLDKPNPPNLDIISIGFYLKIMKIAAQISEELYVIEDYIRQISDGKMELSMVLPELRAVSNNIMSADLFDAEEFIAIEFVEKFVKGQLAKQHEMQDKILQRMRYLGYGRILDALGASDRTHIASGFFEEPVSYAGKQQVQHPSTLRKRKLRPGSF